MSLDLLAKCRRCLIVDDSLPMLEIIRSVLVALGMPGPLCFQDSKEALDELMREGADLVIVDYNLGNMNGIQFIARLRNMKDAARAHTPVIMLTAHTEQSRVLAAKEAGVDAFVRKPVSSRELLEKIVFVLSRPHVPPPDKDTISLDS